MKIRHEPLSFCFCLQKEYTQGCKDALIETVKDNIYIVGGAGIAFGVIEVCSYM